MHWPKECGLAPTREDRIESDDRDELVCRQPQRIRIFFGQTIARSRKRVVYVGADETGSSWRGDCVSIKAEDGKTTTKTRFQGVTVEGVSTGITMNLEGDQLTRVFSDWTFGDGRQVLEKWYEPVVFRRII
ncbi:hypothetical protein N9D23_12345 [Rubripirellula sp.]|nr:hypothetical protein [Rubripirellula sp.]